MRAYLIVAALMWMIAMFNYLAGGVRTLAEVGICTAMLVWVIAMLVTGWGKL